MRAPRLRRLLTLAVSTVAALATTASPASAAPAAARTLPGTPIAPATITLITGDTVTVSTTNGRTSVDVTPRAGADAFTYSTQQDDDGYYLIPDDAAPLIAAGQLDRRLFNLTYLAANGYADDRTGSVPVIAQYQQKLTATELDRRAGAIPGGADRRSLPSINAAAVDVPKDGRFWAHRDTGGISKLWLDATVTTFDDTSNAQIGAPEAWAAGHDGTGATVGIIDTGVDATHPDLAGRIVASRNFVEAGFPGGGAPGDVTDRHGHGTHVASTVAGSGAASNGRYKGVAPGANLVIAKALDDTGSGPSSAIIAAMEWEAARVDVVSMSLGSGPTDGTDPLSTAVNELTARYGTLFVIAAGNFGPGGFTVAAPGAADAALTVGAVDSADELADFSSRGPRVGDLAIKPEITAPGVNIVAARAAGTSLGHPLDDRYTAASGTSMATPHVAAAAGILAAEHQDWTPAQLKSALTGTTHDGGFSAYDQGAGRLDIGRASTQTVFDDTTTISAKVTYPYDGQAVRKTITYRNTGTFAVTLDVSASLTHDGSPAPPGMATVSSPSVTVAPGGTASVGLTLDPSVAAPGWYDGRLTASDPAGTRLAVPIALWLQAEQHTVRLRLTGDPAWSMSSTFADAALMSDTDPRFAGEPRSKVVTWHTTGTRNTLEATVSLARGGTYALTTNVFWYGADRQVQYGQVIRPEITVDGDTTVVLDATKLARVNVATEQPSEPAMASYFYYQTAASGRLYTGGSVLSYPAITPGAYWVSPTGKPRIGSLGFIADETRIAPQVTLRAPGLDVHPHYISDRLAVVPTFTGDRRVGFATERELRAGKDVRGRLVFLTPAPIETFRSDLDAAIAAGAAGVITGNYLAWAMVGDASVEHMKIPLLWVNGAEAATLARGLPRSASLHAELTSPYEYKAVYYLRDGIPAKVDLFTRDRDLARVDTTYHARFAPKQGRWGPIAASTEVQHTFVPEQSLSVRGSHEILTPGSRAEYYTTPGADVLWERAYRFGDLVTGADRFAASRRGFTRGTRETEDWNEALLPGQFVAGPALPGTGQAQLICDTCRQGDTLRLRSLGAAGLPQIVDVSDPSHEYQNEPGTEEIHLYRDGVELTPGYDAYGLPSYAVPAGAASYRLTDVYTDGFAGPHGGTTVSTDWRFRSSRPATGTVAAPYACIDSVLFHDSQPCAWQPLIQLSYDLGVPGDDTAKAGRPFTFTVTPRVGGKTIAPRELTVWISADGGTHWTRTTVTRGRDAYRVTVTNPRAAGPVAIRAEATDRAGNSVHQTILDAYQVR